MGGFATHAIFGKEVLEEIGDELLTSVIQKHRGVFGIGCQGPDLFLYNVPMLLSNEEKNLGLRMHKECTSRYFAWLLQTIWEEENVEAVEVGLSYLYGALAHYTLDTMLHPYVYARIGLDASMPNAEQITSGPHHRLESAIDAKMLAVKEDKLPSEYIAGESLLISKQEKELLAKLLSKAVSKSYRIHLKEENVKASIRMMKIISSGFYVTSDKQKEKLQKLEFPFMENYGLTNFMVTDDFIRKRRLMNTENNVWYNPWDKSIASTDSVWELYDKAVVQYHEYCEVLGRVLPYFKRKWLTNASPNTLYRRMKISDWQRGAKRVYKEKSSDIMKQTENNVVGIFAAHGEDEDTAMQKRIYAAAKSLGNLSYETGLPI